MREACRFVASSVTGFPGDETKLAVEVQVGFRTLTGMRVAGVKQSFTVSGPGGRTSGGGVLNPRDTVIQFFAAARVEDMQRTVLATVLREANGYHGSVR
jgi:hypothetical protein